MRMLHYLTAALALTCSLAQGEQYLCVADKATGFKWDNLTATWKSVDFVADEKWLIRRSVEPYFAWTIAPIGDKAVAAFCKDDFVNDTLSCEFSSGFMGKQAKFLFNRAKGRYLYAFAEGYIYGDGDMPFTPYLEIGKCSALPG